MPATWPPGSCHDRARTGCRRQLSGHTNAMLGGAHNPYSSSSAGGCNPVANNARRMFTTPGLFTCSALTVARPVGVKPTMRVKSSFHLKWSRHLCFLGLYSGTTALSTGSGASVLVYLWALHPGQANARLSNVVSPPRLTGMVCSTENDWVAKSAGLRQYSQRPLARSATIRRS